MQSVDERALLERAQTYDPAALAEIYDRYSGKIYSYILYQVGDEELAADLTSNVFTKMLDAIKSAKSWHSSFSSWLYRIAHNAVVDHFRRSSHEKFLPLDERLVSAKEDPVTNVENKIEAESIRQALAYLTVEQRTVIILKFFEGFSNLEVAKVMGKTEGAIKSLQYQALGAMRRYLERDGEIGNAEKA